MVKDLLRSTGEAGRFSLTLATSNDEIFCTGLELLGRFGGPTRLSLSEVSVSSRIFGGTWFRIALVFVECGMVRVALTGPVETLVGCLSLRC